MCDQDYRCERIKQRTGYKGQKYEVQFKEASTGEWKTFGWQNEPDGGLLTSVKLWPNASDGRIVPVTEPPLNQEKP